MELKNLGQTAASALIHTDIRLEREHWTMFRNNTLGIAAAATLGLAAMLGSTAAHAVKVCTAVPADRAALMGATCADSTTFAVETLLEGDTNTTEASDSSDTTTYYNIADNVIHLAAPADIGGGGDDYTVTVMLDGMVFKTATPALAATGTGTPAFVVAAGGAAGDKSVEFELSTGTIDATTGVLQLDADFAVSAGGGSATLTMSNPSLQGTTTMTHGPANVVKMAAALDEKVVAMNPTADVAADGFMKFLNDRTTASLGTVEIAVKAMHRKASDGAAAAALADIMGDATATPAVPAGTVSFSGDFSFASSVFLHGDADCGAAATDAHVADPNSDTSLAAHATNLLVTEGTGVNEVVTGKTSPVDVNTLVSTATPAAPLHLCIMIDPEADDAMPIPATDAYTAMGSYNGIADAAIGPMPEEQTLGMIRRNGVTIRIPYVTTYSGYNQRLVLVNRGPQASYKIEFMPEDGIMADPESMGGMLPSGTSIMLTRDIVTLSGGSRTAASVTVEAQPHLIDAATVTVNNEDGSTDTVTHTDN